ncbi:acyl-coenzyme A synthetase/AMP-(fatty) acid ligase [Pseudacidovorax sp. 1753]|uniref:acyl-CoA synthetase n=1 Tax=Pseudacidovorax sp. 1753 TaxID=3156419 RepID=UPI003399E8AB
MTPNTHPAYWPQETLLSLEDVQRFERVPLSQRSLPASTYEMLMDGCAIDPSKVAIDFFADGSRIQETARKVTFAELRSRVNQTANLLTSLGVSKDDVVSVLMPAVPESQFLLWGAQAAGIVNPANWMLEPEILVHMFRSARTKVLAVYGGEELGPIWPKVEAVARELGTLSAIIRVGGTSPCPAEVAGVRVIDYESSVSSFPADALSAGRVFSPDDTASLFHTGGTTGAPKLARHLHRNQVYWVWAFAHVVGAAGAGVVTLGVPVFHVAGAIVCCYSTLARGGRVLMLTSAGFRNPSVLPNIWRIVQAYRVNLPVFVPTLVNQLLSVPIGDSDISSIQYVGSSTAPLSATVAEAFREMTGSGVRESWGMTETVAVTCVTPPTESFKPGSSGIRLPYTQVRIVQADEAGRVVRDCAPGESGLVVVRGPSVFPGYLDQDHGPRWIDGDWLDTGDLGHLDHDQSLWITGRSKDLIIRGGHNIDPKMVEESLFGMAGIQDAAVIGAPDAHAGEVPVAYVVLKPGSKVTAEDVIAHAASSLSERAAVPKFCYLVPEMPKTLVGKIQKNVLRVDAIERMFRLALETSGVGEGLVIKVVDLGSKGFHVDVGLKGLNSTDRRVRDALRPFTVSYEIKDLP